MARAVSFKDLITDEVILDDASESMPMLRALVPSSDGTEVVMTTEEFIATLDLWRPQDGWKVASRLPLSLTMEDQLARTVRVGRSLVLLLQKGLAMVLDEAGEPTCCFALPENNRAGSAFDDFLAVPSYVGDNIGVYRLLEDEHRVEVLLHPLRKVHKVVPGAIDVENVFLDESGIHFFANRGRRVHTVRLDASGLSRFRQLADDVILPSAVKDDAHCVRLRHRTYAVDMTYECRLVDRERALCHPTALPSALVNRPLEDLLRNAGPVTIKALGLASAAAAALWAQPLSFDKAREILVSVTANRCGEIWVATTRRVVKLDRDRLEAMVRHARWGNLDRILEETYDVSDHLRAALVMRRGRRGWLRRVLSLIDEHIEVEQLVGEARVRGLGPEDVYAAFADTVESAESAVAEKVAELAVQLTDAPCEEAIRNLESDQPVRRRLALTMITSVVPSRLEVAMEGPLSLAFLDDSAGRTGPAERIRRHLHEAVAASWPNQWPAETAAALVALEDPRSKAPLHTLLQWLEDPVERVIAVFGLLNLAPEDPVAVSAYEEILADRGSWSNDYLHMLAFMPKIPERLVEVACSFVGGFSTESALSVLACGDSRRFFRAVLILGGIYTLYSKARPWESRPLPNPECDEELTRMLRDLENTLGPGPGSDTAGAMAVSMLALAFPGSTYPVSFEIDRIEMGLPWIGGVWAGKARRSLPADSDEQRRVLYEEVVRALWKSHPDLASILVLLAPLVPFLKVREAGRPAQRRRGSVVAMGSSGAEAGPMGEGFPNVDDCTDVLSASDCPLHRTFWAVWRAVLHRDHDTSAVEALLEPGALSPFEDLRYLLVPSLPSRRVQALGERFASSADSPLWYDKMISTIEEEQVEDVDDSSPVVDFPAGRVGG